MTIEEIKKRMAELEAQMAALECGDEAYLPLNDEWKVLRDQLKALEQ